MCDYSLSSVKSRAAAKDDQLIVRNFGTGTKGFSDLKDPTTAVCVLPGTELAFDQEIKSPYLKAGVVEFLLLKKQAPSSATAIFRQINVHDRHSHHDCLELPDSRQILLTHLVEGQTCRILALPAAPKTAKEAKQQERVAYAG